MVKYYAVTAKCGHVKRNNYIEVTFAIRAEHIHEATKIARGIPRVKHHRKDAISDAREISAGEYNDLRQKNDNNPYLHCASVQEQNQYWDFIQSQIKVHQQNEIEKADRIRREAISYRKKKEKEKMESLMSWAMKCQNEFAALAY